MTELKTIIDYKTSVQITNNQLLINSEMTIKYVCYTKMTDKYWLNNYQMTCIQLSINN